MADSITALLKEQLNYDPMTGVFIWKTGFRRGKVAGCLRKDGYRLIRFNGVLRYAHHLTWLYTFGWWPEMLDHKDGNKSFNAIDNLRETNKSQNGGNSKRVWFHTLPKGVTAHQGKFMVRLVVDYKSKYIGVYSSVEEAEEAYKTAAEEAWGEFAYHKRELA